MRLLIEDARVWDGTGAAPFPGKVLIDGERIAAVAPQSASIAADGAERIDAKGKFLMPGIIDTHTHLPLDVSIVPGPKANQDNIITGGRAALAGGITSLGDFMPIRNVMMGTAIGQMRAA